MTTIRAMESGRAADQEDRQRDAKGLPREDGGAKADPGERRDGSPI